MTDTFERPLTENEVADILGVSPNTLRHWRWVGKGPRFVKIVSKVGYQPSDLRAWLDANTTDPGAQPGT